VRPDAEIRAEEIAGLVASVRTGRFTGPNDFPTARYRPYDEKWAISQNEYLAQMSRRVAEVMEGPTVDVTPWWHTLGREHLEGVNLYEDHDCCFAPWETGWLCTANTYKVKEAPRGSTAGTMFWSTTRQDYDLGNVETRLFPDRPEAAPATTWHDATWDSVNVSPAEWEEEIGAIISSVTFYRGPNKGRPGYLTVGPVWMIRLAIDYDGKLRDANWTRIVHEDVMEDALMHNDVLVLVSSLNFLNCRNISVEDAAIGRPARKRIARLGVNVSHLTVTPIGKYRRSAPGRVPLGDGMPLTSVRGHIIRSGVEGRKHLFGNPNIVGRFWVPQHARGSAEWGETIQEFELRPERAS